jgi:hypothetical protein
MNGIIFIVLMIALTLYSVYLYVQGQDQKHIWQIIRHGGGGSIFTPKPMTEEQAMHWALSLGSVMHVDRQHHIIFYRPN